jgi:hypothetical protein
MLVLLVAAGFAAAGIGSGKAPAATAISGVAADSSIHVRVGLQRFQVDKSHHRLVANGTVVASYRSGGAVRATTVKPVRLAVQTSTCRVLHLELGQLQLQLLGLIVTLTPVNAPSIVLDITADSSEALGHLLCQVINAVQSGSLTNATTPMSKLNVAAKKQFKGGVASFDIPLKSQSGAATTTGATTTTTSTTPTTPVMRGQCEVLDLILGPLHLDLLGLVVDLNTIELNISANPVGALGTLFCGLAGTGTGTSTTGATTTGTTSTTP